ncbi:hypothetical protein, partial [Thiolapillus sp.]
MTGIVVADYRDPSHQKALLDLLDDYARDPMGGGKGLSSRVQACLRPRERFWDIPVPKIDSAFDNLFVPQPSWSPSTTQQL